MSLPIFAFLGTINLLFNLINELKNKEIKDYHNYFMAGVAISLIPFFPLSLLKLGLLILLSLIISVLFKIADFLPIYNCASSDIFGIKIFSTS